MKRLIYLAVLATLSAGAGAGAQSPAAVEAVHISGAMPRIELPEQIRNVWYDEFDQLKGTYYLSNGKTMQLSMWGNRMYAKIDGMPRSQLIAVTPYVFVALDEKMKITIDNNPASDRINAELLLAGPAMADGSRADEITRILASR